ncbi:MAG: ChbG/HpnK family deacetylase [Candidatus Omnitrophica bacterium]|nr:ChbG/HpnK family deacetylase [Candidatus Omnitrophota bacterium]
MKRILIVNADDCNLTQGVTEAILDCHDRGIVTSTTILVNLPVDSRMVRETKKRQSLGIGIHLNITLGRPVSNPKKIKSLLDPSDCFRKFQSLLKPPRPKADEIFHEYQSQIELFQKIFGRRPTHADTHHQVHDDPYFFQVIIRVARENRLPIRRSQLMRQSGLLKKTGVRSTDFIFGNLRPEGHWTSEAVRAILPNLPNGISEIICHPGRNDSDLKSISSFTAGRETEWRIFRSKRLKAAVQRSGIVLSHYGLYDTG